MTSGDRPLEEYREKRDFRQTDEPRGEDGSDPAEDPVFVVQKHDASSLHYDVRLEVDGVLASWAVPKGPSTDPREKRLAIRTEDHPLAYAEFEGVIPEGEYGGGTVLVWDAGTFRNLRTDEDDEEIPLRECLEEGQVEVWLRGEKISGGYALVRTDADDDGERWLLVKMDDDQADARRNPVSTEPASVLSGRDLEDIRADEEDDPES
jgi:DNA ligase D-like protein (predicted 3'-phosphoesterase)